MNVVHGIVSGGKIELSTPVDWPDGMEVEVRPSEETVGVSEIEQGDDPESIARWLAWLDSLEPFLMPEEEEEWKKARAKQKAFNLSKVEERAERLRKMWE